MVGTLGILISTFLGITSEKSKAEVDEKRILVHNELPGNNCDGCGYTGCDALAKAITAGQADVGVCSAGDASTAEKVGATMDIAGGVTEKKVTFVRCKGLCDKTTTQHNYYGVNDCKKAPVVPGAGERARAYRYMGYGSCIRACTFNAIHVMNGVAVVDREKYVACGKCVTSCPNHPIKLVPYKTEHLVQCSSHDKGRDVKAVYTAGCIGYTPYIKQCELGIIHMKDNLAATDYEKCTNCGKCAEKRPVKAIV